MTLLNAFEKQPTREKLFFAQNFLDGFSSTPQWNGL